MFEGDEKLICHSCNILGGFGSGVAGEIARRYPYVRKAYLKSFNLGQLKLGALQFVKKTDDFDDNSIICNMMCQPTYGGPGTRHVSYDAVDIAIKTLNKRFDWEDEDKAGMTLWYPDEKIIFNSSEILLKPIFENEMNPFLIPEVAFPLFGSALGGGSWAVCAAILEYHSTKFQPVVYTLDGNIPK